MGRSLTDGVGLTVGVMSEGGVCYCCMYGWMHCAVAIMWWL